MDPSRFRIETDLVDGLYKAAQIDGYPGYFKTKTVIVHLPRSFWTCVLRRAHQA